jgi:hypothetical protein
MSDAAVINEGDHFLTLRRPARDAAEVAHHLRERGTRRVYKGDQNQFWDALVANECLRRAVADGTEDGALFFVQDEKLGTPDIRLTPLFRREGRHYVLTEDYFGRRAGAVWEHQDASYGLFYTEAVSPEQFAAAAVHLPRAAEAWARLLRQGEPPAALLDALERLGVSLRWDRSDRATRLGPPVHTPILAQAFRRDPVAGFFYAFTKSTGLYGIVPAANDDVTTSSIPVRDAELTSLFSWLLVHVAARGAMRAAGSRAHRRQVKERARAVADWATGFLRDCPGASVAEFQAAFSRAFTTEIFGRVPEPLERTSHFTGLDAEDQYRLKEPADTLYFFLDLALRHPAEFAGAYNDALNRVGFGLQRVKYDVEGRRYLPPFFVEHAPEGEGTAVYRYSLELSGEEWTQVALLHPKAGTLSVASDRPVRSAAELFRVLFRELNSARIAVVGKAAPFAAELARWPRAMALPEQGSRYSPMIDHLLAGLRDRGVLERSDHLVLRIGLNALDRVGSAREMPIRLPVFLRDCLGRELFAVRLAAEWRAAAALSREAREALGRLEVGQHAPAMKVIAATAARRDVQAEAARDPKLARFLARPAAAAALPHLQRLGGELPAPVADLAQDLLTRREALLAERRSRRAETPEAVQRELAGLDTQLLLLYAALVRRLWQRAESLPYLNDRPYSLALYLLFGPSTTSTWSSAARSRARGVRGSRQRERDECWVLPALAPSTHHVLQISAVSRVSGSPVSGRARAARVPAEQRGCQKTEPDLSSAFP